MSWYYAENGTQKGPLSDQDWLTLVATETIKPDTLVWQEGMTNWLPYAQIKKATGEGDLSSAPFEPLPAGMVMCAFCKKPQPSDEVISMNGQLVCANCKPIAVQMMREGVSAPGELKYAGFGIRFGAKFIDGIIGYIFGIMLGVLLGLTKAEAAPIIASLLGIAFQAGYAIFFNGKYGATLGKMACGLKIVRPDGAPLTYGRAAGRYFAEWISSLTLAIGYIMAGFDKECRALHDRIADTRVIKK